MTQHRESKCDRIYAMPYRQWMDFKSFHGKYFIFFWFGFGLSLIEEDKMALQRPFTHTESATIITTERKCNKYVHGIEQFGRISIPYLIGGFIRFKMGKKEFFLCSIKLLFTSPEKKRSARFVTTACTNRRNKINNLNGVRSDNGYKSFMSAMDSSFSRAR